MGRHSWDSEQVLQAACSFGWNARRSMEFIAATSTLNSPLLLYFQSNLLRRLQEGDEQEYDRPWRLLQGARTASRVQRLTGHY